MSDGNREPPKKGIPAEYVIFVAFCLFLAGLGLWGLNELGKWAITPAPRPAYKIKSQPPKQQQSPPQDLRVDPFATP